MTAPSRPGLPGGGGYAVSGLYDVTPAKFGQILNNVTDSKTVGETSQVFNGVDVTLNLRQGGLTLQGGISTGQTTADFCDVRNNLPELNLAHRRGPADVEHQLRQPVVRRVERLPHAVPRPLVLRHPEDRCQVSAVFQSKPGPAIVANWAVPAAVVAQSLGRPPAGGVPNVTVNLLDAGTVYGNRINQLDLRIAKNVRFGGTRTMLSVDLYNALNTGAI